MIIISTATIYRQYCTTAAGKMLTHFRYIFIFRKPENLFELNFLFCLLEKVQTSAMIHICSAVTVVAVFAMYRCCIRWQRNSKREQEKEQLAEISNRRTERAEIQLNVQRERSEQVRAIATAIQRTIHGIYHTVSTILNGRQQTMRLLAQINLRRDEDTSSHNAWWWRQAGAAAYFVVVHGPTLVGWCTGV